MHAQVAKIYISVYSDPKGRKVAMRGLSHLEGYVRKHIASSMNMRLCPEIRFIQDDSIQRGEEVRSPRCSADRTRCSILQLSGAAIVRPLRMLLLRG